MQLTLLGWLVLELTDSPFSVALVGFFGMLPLLILGMVGGVLADRVSKHRILIMTQVVSCVAAFVMVLLLKTETVRFWHAYVVMGCTGIGWALGYAIPSFSYTRPCGESRSNQCYCNGLCGYAGEPHDWSCVGGCADNHG